MEDLEKDEREAMEVARDSFQPIHGGIHPSDRGRVVWKREGFETGWRAKGEQAEVRLQQVEAERNQLREIIAEKDLIIEINEEHIRYWEDKCNE